MVDWTAHYSALYSAIGVDAVLTLDDTAGTELTLRVIDKTAGVELSLGGNVDVPTVKPACAVRVTELTEQGVDLDDVRGSSIAFNSGEWRIEDKRFKPGPSGEMRGEVYLILIETEQT